MDRIATSTALADAHGVGKAGFTDGNPLAGILATHLNAVWFDGAQEEMVAGIIEHLGLVPAAGDMTQVRQALSRWFGGAVRTVIASTALTAADAGLVLVSAASGNVALTLPAANSANGRPIRLVIVRTDTSAVNDVTLVRAGVDTVNGVLAGSYDVPVNARLTLVSDGVSDWLLVSAVALEQMNVMSSSGSITGPWWARNAEVAVWGAGGGGGYGGTGGAGGGGAGGSVGWGTFRVIPRTTFTVTVGAGGAGGPGIAVHGSAGGTTSFGTLISAPGGGGGSSSGTGSGAGGAGGGAPAGGVISAVGTPGAAALSLGGTPCGGVGGSPLGGGQGGAASTSGGRAPTPPGGGGGGGANGNAGGAGQVGWVRVIWRP